eukprot:2164061-Prymnesium_polylepis.1
MILVALGASQRTEKVLVPVGIEPPLLDRCPARSPERFERDHGVGQPPLTRIAIPSIKAPRFYH